jgi:hypothetical protein
MFTQLWLVLQRIVCENELSSKMAQNLRFARNLSCEPGQLSQNSDGLRARRSALDSTTSRLALAPAQPPIQWVPGALSQGVKQPRCEAEHSPPPNAEGKTGGFIPPLPHSSLWRGA